MLSFSRNLQVRNWDNITTVTICNLTGDIIYPLTIPVSMELVDNLEGEEKIESADPELTMEFKLEQERKFF